MKLHEHEDFEQAIIRAEEHFSGRGIRLALIEKDYFVTETLRVLAETAGDQVIFKGGTSLSKGWDLIDRFSEDIDLFLDPEGLGKKTIDKRLKRLRDGATLDADNEGPFEMRLLHFRRTFVEKLFAIHKKVELYKRNGTPVGPHARHYYDLFQLAGRDEVIAMLRSPEYAEIKDDYERVSLEHFPEHYFCPEAKSFAKSDAIFPPAELAEVLGPAYEEQCAMLCYRAYPTWGDVTARLQGIRSLL